MWFKKGLVHINSKQILIRSARPYSGMGQSNVVKWKYGSSITFYYQYTTIQLTGEVNNVPLQSNVALANLWSSHSCGWYFELLLGTQHTPSWQQRSPTAATSPSRLKAAQENREPKALIQFPNSSEPSQTERPWTPLICSTRGTYMTLGRWFRCCRRMHYIIIFFCCFCFRGCHGRSSASMLPCPSRPYLSSQPSSYHSSLHLWIFFVVFFSCRLAAQHSSAFVPT